MKKLMIIIICLLPLIVVLTTIISTRFISNLTYIPVQSVTIVDKYSKEEISGANIVLENYLGDNGKELKKFMLTAKVAPRLARNQEIIWTSSDENVATVHNGEVSFKGGYGGVTIFAESEDKASARASVRLFVTDERVRNLNLTIENSVVSQYGSYKIEATANPFIAIGNNSLEWSTEDIQGINVLTVDSNGIISANKIGKARVTATLNGVYLRSDKSYTISSSIEIEVRPSAKLFTVDELYVEGDSIDLNSYLVNRNAVLSTSTDNAIISDGILSYSGSGEVTVNAEFNNKADSATVIFTGGKIVVDIAYSEKIFTDGRINLWLDSKYYVFTPYVKTVDTQFDIEDLCLISSNEEILVFDDDYRINAVGNGTATVQAFLTGRESEAKEYTINVYSPVSDFTLNYNEYEDNVLFTGTRVFGNYSYWQETGEINNIFKIGIKTLDGKSLEESGHILEDSFNFESMSPYATVDDSGNVRFDENHDFSQGEKIRIRVTTEYSATGAPLFQEYVFNVVNGINMGQDFTVKPYEDGVTDYTDFTSYEAFNHLQHNKWYRSLGEGTKDFIIHKYTRAELSQLNTWEEFLGNVVLHCDIYIPSTHETNTNIFHGIEGNGHKIDSQIWRKTATKAWQPSYRIFNEIFEESDITNVLINNLEFDCCEPRDDVMFYADAGGIAFEIFTGSVERGVTFNGCLFQYAYVHLSIRAGDVKMNSCIMRNVAYCAIAMRCTNSEEPMLTFNNSIISNTSGPGIVSYTHETQDYTTCLHSTIKIIGTSRFYNWKTPDNVRLDFVPADAQVLNMPASQLNEQINKTVSQEMIANKEDLLYYDENTKKYYMNFGVFYVGFWDKTNKIYDNEARESSTMGHLMITDNGILLKTFDLKKCKTALGTLISRSQINGNSFIVDVLDKNGNPVVAPDEAYEDLTSDEVLAILRGEE